MPYVSTRGGGDAVSAGQAILQGLAPDGGLFMPQAAGLPLPSGQDYGAIAAELLDGAFGESYSKESILRMVDAGYRGNRFEDEAVCPLRPVGSRHVLELFHGPTASFKDLALSLLPPLMAKARDQLMPNQNILVLTATSGDTGSATMAGFRDLPGIKVIVFYPHQGVSPVQAAQMQRMAGDNLRAVAIRGDFDQAQQGVKAIFQQADRIAPHVLLSSANSINIGRLIPQMAYYVDAVRRLGRNQAPVFAVPTGNFGDIFAGMLCQAAGLPVAKLLCATNDNRVLADALDSGLYDRRRALIKTLSPSMDILLSSNFERALYLAADGEPAVVRGLMSHLEQQGWMQLPAPLLTKLQQRIFADSSSDQEGLQAVRRVWDEHGYLLDPHTAAAWLTLDSYEAQQGDVAPGIVLATASPYKFPEAALRALQQDVPSDAAAQLEKLQAYTGLPLPRALQGLFEAPILHQELIDPQDMAAYVREKALAW